MGDLFINRGVIIFRKIFYDLLVPILADVNDEKVKRKVLRKAAGQLVMD